MWLNFYVAISVRLLKAIKMTGIKGKTGVSTSPYFTKAPHGMKTWGGVILSIILLLCWYSGGETDLVQGKCADHQYSVEIISQDPLMIYINDFLSEGEISSLLKQGESRYERMLTYQGNSLSDKALPDDRKTSFSAFLSKDDPVVTCIGRRALDFHGGTQRALGDYGNPQLVKYGTGQKNDLHVDWWLEPQNRSGRLYNRRTTTLAYLDDDCTQGETFFPYINAMNDSAVDAFGNPQKPRFWTNEDGNGLYVAPKRGNAIFWVNLKANGQGDERTLHAALPVGTGSKVAMNFWPPQYF